MQSIQDMPGAFVVLSFAVVAVAVAAFRRLMVKGAATVSPDKSCVGGSRYTYDAARLPPHTGKSYVVIGGAGFLGSHVVEALLARGERRITVFDLRASKLFANEEGVTCKTGNILDTTALDTAVKGADVVIHAAAAVNYWAWRDFESEPCQSINVDGTTNVVSACKACGVGTLLFVSSSSVVCTPSALKGGLVEVDEASSERTSDAGPPYVCHYVRTKAEAERLVLGANDPPRLATVAIRPGGIYGPRDRMMSTPAIDGAPGIGLETNSIEFTFVGNVVMGLLCAEASISHVAGRAFFVTDRETQSGGEREASPTYYEFWETYYAQTMGKRFDVMPATIADMLAAFCETVCRVCQSPCVWLGDLHKLRSSTLVLSRSTYTTNDAALRQAAGYTPLFGWREAIGETARHLRAELGIEPLPFDARRKS